MSEAVTAEAPAKINLYLHVTGQRADGFHTLDTLIAFAGIGDEITARSAETLRLEIDGPFAGVLQAGAQNPVDNLVLKAARALADYAGVPERAHISLTKNLPIAAGIGGGSADAAAALKALTKLWQIPWDADAMLKLAATLGADVPMCLAGETAFAGGIGEQLSPAPPLPAYGLVLVNPGVALSTPDVFAARTGDFSEAARFTDAPRDAAAFAQILAARRNDLAEAATALAPVIGDVLTALDAAGAHLARMSGSGATCFGLFDDLGAAKSAAKRLQTDQPDWWVAATKLASG
ncbi:MAG: 4-(cytidine 5'-diphospho)-2-C-methyl-D-erythritol kinase [Rhodospirillaceae bacterium]|jgi:4-diphosphocytidyl-2-C-methyl-D-erythritol kinase|nr:4-(cytidine 5'-diphospho)-2-C-methyl-D-erythritol kinase [Rhodospirillaceae bacterium]MBT3883473.1 4-(cytidine 5'-diphospho)-2-C-methyl-D-erythritol kinase [Rhodospirillaceae bacterium]MBT4114790.1 4-(cytidine 5'-diphospho)-2-C-methyl-D-erythritol kinase [Rhodospirillaceae bacterium]MBT4674115.1 4-(cytidine 5'-diphospho)-2-C-methyl-D-erythritol kinase [Rhodospirillaceae bacterium]MBT4721423.1 4-(cytidine 5'-diphospho)-2-C-methyl-D-erythritol kinase [Rhodospirillaceae bacterium]